MVDNYATFFNCTLVGRASDSMMARLKAIHFSWLGPELFVCCVAHRGSAGVFFLFRISVNYWAPRISIVGQLAESMSPRFFLFIMVVIMIYLLVHDESLSS